MPQSSPHKKPSLLARMDIPSLEVTCVERKADDDTLRGIVSIGCASGEKISLEIAIENIKENRFVYFVKNNAGNDVDLEIAHHDGTLYLRTQKDDEKNDNLLNLKKCQ
ncbi:MAG: DUF3892 domain-containing protein [Ottowia sp.]|nr:DUF3892 domain-containing protein [Ottowia sp.]